jgi:hypothetical protein
MIVVVGVARTRSSFHCRCNSSRTAPRNARFSDDPKEYVVGGYWRTGSNPRCFQEQEKSNCQARQKDRADHVEYVRGERLLSLHSNPTLLRMWLASLSHDYGTEL